MSRLETAQAGAWAVCAARRRWADWAVARIVGLGGFAIVASIVTILAFLGAETWPLLRGASVESSQRVRVPAEPPVISAAVDEYREHVQLLRSDGGVEWVGVRDGKVLERVQLPEIGGRIVSARQAGKQQVVAWLDDGSLLAASALVQPVYEPQGKRLVPSVQLLGRWKVVPPGGIPQKFAVSAVVDGGMTVAWLEGSDTVSIWSVQRTTSLFGEGETTESRGSVAAMGVSALALDTRGTRLLLGHVDGTLAMWDLRDPQSPQLIDRHRVAGAAGVEITALAYLIGDQSFVVGDNAGHVSVWQPIRDRDQVNRWRLVEIHRFVPHAGAVRTVDVSQRDKGFVTADDTGEVALRHSTSEQTLLRLRAGKGPVALARLSPRGDGILAVGEDTGLHFWAVQNPHPEITLRTLFGRVWYEGYAEPEYVWQSSGGTDDFEPKFSLIPLVFGTAKGTIYALTFAVPIAVLAAMYTALFSPPGLRNAVKPAVEVMAALPSVVLGFVAGLVLAPALERHMPGFLLALLLAPVTLCLIGIAWYATPRAWRRRLPRGFEVAAAAAVLAGLGVCCWQSSAQVESWLFAGNFRNWLFTTFGSRFDQRNCVVVGIAMGFAVIPLIFSITEEALSNVPQRLISASLALGATRWQTAVRVVLPAASPGILSAVMIGFGRAVGETMIVLMATGNTPVLDWSIFTGMRTLSANIAVEIPEAPYASTLYRVLFLAALLLFSVTFVVNTLAEMVRHRLRQRYQRL